MNTIAEALATSHLRASEFTRSLFEESWASDQVVDFINQCRNATIATTNLQGQPHAAVVIAGSVDQGIYFTVAPSSLLARNMVSNDRVAFSVCDSHHAVMGQGRGVRVGKAPELRSLIEKLAKASNASRFTPDGWDGDLFTIDIRRIFAN
ncbi:MAG: pyridoxamine 5'-phosphate oxidase family protein [Ilumatobacteraceae bacterium]